MKKIILKSKKDTITFANKLAKKLSGGQVIGLVGELGAGKTFFTKALGKALGVKETIKSPSFNLMKVYSITKTQKHENTKTRKHENTKTKRWVATFVHVDCYRLNGARGLVDIGFLDYLGRDDVLVVVEWADKVKKIMPKKAIWLEFEVRGEERLLTFNFISNIIEMKL